MSKTYNLRWLFAAALVIFTFTSASSQALTVKGKITDSKQAPLIGVAVVIKNSPVPTGTSTDINGNYEIKISGEDAVLEASYIGYQSVEAKVGDRSMINFVMEDKNIAFDDVVVIGYGVQQKSHLTGSISKLEGGVLADLPVSDVATALQGQIAGLSINHVTSEVGVTPEIRVRGVSSVGAESSPLVIVDGFPVADGLSSVNAADIQSIEVLKDAASAAIYGSRAANGVIMITTKSGAVDKPKYTVKFYSGFKYAYKLHDMMSSSEALDRMNWESEQPGNIISSGYLTQARQVAWLEQQLGYTDWQRQGLHDAASINNIQVSVQGGKKDMRYYVSTSYVSDEGLMLQNKSDKITIRSKIDANLSSKVSFGANISGSYNKNTRPVNNFIDFYRYPSCLPVKHDDVSTGLTGFTGYIWPNQFNSMWSPTNGVDANGNPIWETASIFNSANPNPLYVMKMSERGSESFGALGNIYLAIDIIEGLQFRTSNGVNFKFAPSYRFEKANALKSGNPTQATYNSEMMVDLLTENTITYQKKIKKHNVNLLAGYTYQKTRRDYVNLDGTGFATDDIKTLNAATVFRLVSNANNGKTAGTGTFKVPNEVLQSFLARLNYSYADKYLLSAAIRLDQSSLFAKGNRDAWFPSVSLGWRLSEEDFMKPVSWISSLKLRASYGKTGNKNVPYTASMDLVNNANYPFGDGSGALAPGLAVTNTIASNVNTTWELTNEWNFGLDWGVLGNRINVTLDAYYSRTEKLLSQVPIPSYSGFNHMWDNRGKIQNKGIEIQVNSVNMNRPNLKWETTANISMNRNKVLDLGGDYQSIYLGERSEQYLNRVGYPLVQFYGYKTMGIWNTQAELDDPNNAKRVGDKVGGLRVYPSAGNNYISDADLVALGNPYPDFTWSLTNSLRFHNFDLSIMFQGVQGVSVINGDFNYNESQKWNRAYIKDRWVSPDHKGNGLPAYFVKAPTNPMLTDMVIEDASYLCLRNFTLGYTFNANLLKKVGITNLRLYASGQNLLYIWSDGYRGINPESRMTSGAYNNPMVSGYQRGGFPVSSTITFGVDFNF